MRRHLVLGIVTAIVSLFVAIENTSWGMFQLDADVIKAGLRTTDIEEDGFVEEVVDMANSGELPWAMVDNVFGWAKQKPKNRFQYFRKALIELAARQGIVVPRPPQPAETPTKSSFFIQKLKDFYAALKGTTAKLPLIGHK